jgi:hypothetical protein
MIHKQYVNTSHQKLIKIIAGVLAMLLMDVATIVILRVGGLR